jgi:hypothetical protein
MPFKNIRDGIAKLFKDLKKIYLISQNGKM